MLDKQKDDPEVLAKIQHAMKVWDTAKQKKETGSSASNPPTTTPILPSVTTLTVPQSDLTDTMKNTVGTLLTSPIRNTGTSPAMVTDTDTDTDTDAAGRKPAGTKPVGTKTAGTKTAGMKTAGMTTAGMKTAGTTTAGTTIAGTTTAGTIPAAMNPAATMTPGMTPVGTPPGMKPRTADTNMPVDASLARIASHLKGKEKAIGPQAPSRRPAPRRPGKGTGQLHTEPCENCVKSGKDCEQEEGGGACLRCWKVKHKCMHSGPKGGTTERRSKIYHPPKTVQKANKMVRKSTERNREQQYIEISDKEGSDEEGGEAMVEVKRRVEIPPIPKKPARVEDRVALHGVESHMEQVTARLDAAVSQLGARVTTELDRNTDRLLVLEQAVHRLTDKLDRLYEVIMDEMGKKSASCVTEAKETAAAEGSSAGITSSAAAAMNTNAAMNAVATPFSAAENISAVEITSAAEIGSAAEINSTIPPPTPIACQGPAAPLPPHVPTVRLVHATPESSQDTVATHTTLVPIPGPITRSRSRSHSPGMARSRSGSATESGEGRKRKVGGDVGHTAEKRQRKGA